MASRWRTWDIESVDSPLETNLDESDSELILPLGRDRGFSKFSISSIILPRAALNSSKDESKSGSQCGRGRSLENRALFREKPGRRPGEVTGEMKQMKFLGSEYLYKESFPGLIKSKETATPVFHSKKNEKQPSYPAISFAKATDNTSSPSLPVWPATKARTSGKNSPPLSESSQPGALQIGSHRWIKPFKDKPGYWARKIDPAVSTNLQHHTQQVPKLSREPNLANQSSHPTFKNACSSLNSVSHKWAKPSSIQSGPQLPNPSEILPTKLVEVKNSSTAKSYNEDERKTNKVFQNQSIISSDVPSNSFATVYGSNNNDGIVSSECKNRNEILYGVNDAKHSMIRELPKNTSHDRVLNIPAVNETSKQLIVNTHAEVHQDISISIATAPSLSNKGFDGKEHLEKVIQEECVNYTDNLCLPEKQLVDGRCVSSMTEQSNVVSDNMVCLNNTSQQDKRKGFGMPGLLSSETSSVGNSEQLNINVNSSKVINDTPIVKETPENECIKATIENTKPLKRSSGTIMETSVCSIATSETDGDTDEKILHEDTEHVGLTTTKTFDVNTDTNNIDCIPIEVEKFEKLLDTGTKTKTTSFKSDVPYSHPNSQSVSANVAVDHFEEVNRGCLSEGSSPDQSHSLSGSTTIHSNKLENIDENKLGNIAGNDSFDPCADNGKILLETETLDNITIKRDDQTTITQLSPTIPSSCESGNINCDIQARIDQSKELIDSEQKITINVDDQPHKSLNNITKNQQEVVSSTHNGTTSNNNTPVKTFSENLVDKGATIVCDSSNENKLSEKLTDDLSVNKLVNLDLFTGDTFPETSDRANSVKRTGKFPCEGKCENLLETGTLDNLTIKHDDQKTITQLSPTIPSSCESDNIHCDIQAKIDQSNDNFVTDQIQEIKINDEPSISTSANSDQKITLNVDDQPEKSLKNTTNNYEEVVSCILSTQFSSTHNEVTSNREKQVKTFPENSVDKGTTITCDSKVVRPTNQNRIAKKVTDDVIVSQSVNQDTFTSDIFSETSDRTNSENDATNVPALKHSANLLPVIEQENLSVNQPTLIIEHHSVTENVAPATNENVSSFASKYEIRDYKETFKQDIYDKSDDEQESHIEIYGEPCDVLLENLPATITKEEVQEIIEPYGEALSFTFVDEESESKTCIVRMSDSVCGEWLVVSLDGLEIDGHRMQTKLDDN